MSVSNCLFIYIVVFIVFLNNPSLLASTYRNSNIFIFLSNMLIAFPSFMQYDNNQKAFQQISETTE